MKLYEEQIKFGGKSAEQNIIDKHVNYLLWDDLHDLKQHIFNIPVSFQINGDLAPKHKNMSVTRSNGSDGPTQNGTFADSRLSNKLENYDSRQNMVATPSVRSSNVRN